MCRVKPLKFDLIKIEHLTPIYAKHMLYVLLCCFEMLKPSIMCELTPHVSAILVITFYKMLLNSPCQ